MRLFLSLLLASTSPAWGHHAKTGWKYDQECCHERDCHVIPLEAVRISSESYTFSVGPEDHPMLRDLKVWTIRFDDRRIRTSGDDDFHLCISPIMHDYRNGVPSGNNLLCIYVPTGGV